MSKIFLFVFLMEALSFGAHAQLNKVDLASSGSQVWWVKAQQNAGPDVLAPRFQPAGWTPAIVPGTVFSAFVAAGLEKDPNFGDNIYQVDRKNYDRNFWYLTDLTIPADYTGKRIWLNFDGVNRQAEIWLNGQRLGNLDGFMHRGRFDITSLVKHDGPNRLAVLVYLPQQPLANVGSPNYVSSAGWDWMPYVPGLNSGITDKVYLSCSGDLTIRDPWVRSELPTNARADLSIALQIRNNAVQAREGILQGTIMPGNIVFSQKVQIGAGEIKDIRLSKRELGQLVIDHPKLWWPNGYGEPSLYDLTLRLRTGDELSDQQHISFGIKRYSFDTTGNVLHIAINGVPIFVKGGDWGMSEYLLRCHGAEYDTRLRLHREMNFNMVRNWIGSVTDEEFYEACDKYGMMIWDEFWLNANPNLPADINTFNANAIEKIKRVRNHPSIAVWCADNEGWPEPPLSNWLKEDLRTFDGGDHYYQANSHADNLTGSGPWMAKDPRYYFTPYPTGLGGNKGWGMRTELGTAVFTNFESFKKFMPEASWWPRNDMWNKHFFGPSAFNAGPDEYDEMIRTGYGSPTGIEDYCRKAQFVNLESNKAMYEGWLDHMGEDASGIMTWMSQPAFPSMVWQTYDYYYDLTGAYFGVKKACEPLHIQWNPVNNAIKVVNTSAKEVAGLTATAEIYNLDGRLVKEYSKTATIASPSNSAGEVFRLALDTGLVDLAKGRKVFASSSADGAPSNVNDGNGATRWASRSADDEWICIDLGKMTSVNGVGLNWETAYASSYRIETSDDNSHWREVYRTDEGRTGPQKISFPEVSARYVRMHGIARGTWWGYSLYDFEVYQGDMPAKGLSDVHFIKLKLTDRSGALISDNFYWRGTKRKDYTALNTLGKADLKLTYRTERSDGKTRIAAQVSNSASSKFAAFGVRLILTRISTGQQILPAIMSDNYFSLMNNESRTINIVFDGTGIKDSDIRLVAIPYNDQDRAVPMPAKNDTPLYRNKQASVDMRVEDLLKRMSLQEKIRQLQNRAAGRTEEIQRIFNGESFGCTHEMSMTAQKCADMYQQLQSYMLKNTRLGIPVLTAAEGIEGVLQDGCTIFPQALAQGSTFNPELVRKMTTAAGEEARVIGIHQILSPVLDLARELRWGRVEETFGEDPYLAARMGTAFVQGYQQFNITCTPKHFLAHGSPSGGLNCANVSGGQRELRSVYLYPFAKVIENTMPLSLMSCYSSYDGVAISGSSYYMTDLLRGELGFKGYVYSDWGSVERLQTFHHAVNTREEAAIRSLEAGVDLDVDGAYETLEKMVTDGRLEMRYIDQAVRRVLSVKFKLGLFDDPYGDPSKVPAVVRSTKNIAIAKEVADESAILLKNEDHILPLDLTRYRRIAVVGPNADQTVFGDYAWTGRDTKEGVTLLKGLSDVIGNKVQLTYTQGCDWWSQDRSGIAAAVKTVEASDLAIVAIGTRSTFLGRGPKYSTAGEGFDLSTLELPGAQEDLLKAVKATGKPLIVVLIAGKPLAMPWVKDNANAILVQWYGGEMQGRTLADILTGKINPSGKLNVSFPRSTGNTPIYYNHYATDRDEPFDSPGSAKEPRGHYIFDRPDPLWAFGSGLSYTTFAYTACTLADSVFTAKDTIKVDIGLQNTGGMDGKEVVQLYVHDLVSSVATPVQQLKAFKKELIPAGRQKKIHLEIPISELGIYNEKMQYVVEPGQFELQIGSAADDIRFTKKIEVK